MGARPRLLQARVGGPDRPGAKRRARVIGEVGVDHFLANSENMTDVGSLISLVLASSLSNS